MKVLIACEFSGIVREAFRRLGHNAWSCDLLPTEIPGQHLECDVRTVLRNGWDLMVAHPPCTHLAVSGARWFREKRRQRELFLAQSRQDEAIEFVRLLLDAPIERIALENPVSILSTTFRPPDQIIQPWHFGHAETKTTCLWLKNLPMLQPTDIVTGRIEKLRVRDEARNPTRWKDAAEPTQALRKRSRSNGAAWIPCPWCHYEGSARFIGSMYSSARVHRLKNGIGIRIQ